MEPINHIDIDVEEGADAVSSSDYVAVDSVQRALRALHLPLRPLHDEKIRHQGGSRQPNLTVRQFPSISILVCADFDLKSTAALAEYTLQQQNEIFDAKSIDLIIAAGPSVGDSEMLKYYQGNNRLKHMQNRNAKYSNRYRSTISENHVDPSYTKDDGADSVEMVASTAPFFRSREESAAFEGLMTAALSQLESIVCRVVYCPGWNDPISLLQHHPQQPSHKRLTSHSRNVHQHYLPLAPGLGCAGLFYLDHTDHIIDHYRRNHSDIDSNQNCDSNNHQHNNDDDSETSEREDGCALLSDQLKKLQQLSAGYYQSLESLLQLAPQPKYPNILFNGRSKGQSILVTHYVDSRSLIDGEKSTMDNCTNYGDDEDDSFDEIFDLSNPLKDERGSNAAMNVSEISNDIDNDDPCGPWPSGHHKFFNSTVARQNLCFEIATGLSSKNRRPEWISSASSTHLTDDETLKEDEGSTFKGPGVLWPGSLREHGDFCIVHMSLVPQQASRDAAACAFGWEVQDVEFHMINNF